MPDEQNALGFAELRRLAEAATPGPWVAVPQSNGSSMIARQYETGKQMNPKGLRLICNVLARGGSLKEDEGNSGFIVAANPAAIVALLDRLASAEAALRVPAKWDGAVGVSLIEVDDVASGARAHFARYKETGNAR